MRKYFEGLSFYGGVFFFSALVLGIIFRVVGLQETSAWGDEVASWYYSQNLSNVFYTESHTPVYYFFCRVWTFIFPTSILSLRYFSIFLSLLVVLFTCTWVKRKKGNYSALILFIIWWLWPTMIIFSRQARHYSLYADLTFLIIVMWNYKKDLNKWLLWSVLALFESIHPIAVLPVFFLSFWDFLRNKKSKDLLWEVSTSFPVSIYYICRVYNQGKENVHANIAWINNDSWVFLKSLVSLHFGDSFPFSLFYPNQLSGVILLSFCVLVIAVYKMDLKFLKTDWLLRPVVFTLATIAIVETLGLLNFNLRISRYYIYLPAFILMGLTEACRSNDEKLKLFKAFSLLVILTGYEVIYHRPWSYYIWDDQNVASFKEDFKTMEPREVVICGNAFQLIYYFNRSYVGCSEEALALHRNRQKFYFFDINGNDKHTMLYLMNESHIPLTRKYEHATLIAIDPK